MNVVTATKGSNAVTIVDNVPRDSQGSREIGFSVPDRYNASDILFDNLDAGRGDRPAVIGAFGVRTYRDLCADASRYGNALVRAGLQKGDRVLLFLDDGPAYPAALFGAIRAGFVPILINTLTPPDLLNFYLADSDAKVAVVEASHASTFDETTRKGTALEQLVTVGASTPTVSSISEQAFLQDCSATLEAAPTTRDDMCFWQYSSGSTGRPKGIVHLQHDMLYTAESYGKHVLKISENDICFSVPKIFFAYGLGC
jgi:acyl-coenzyme A synthetase/AMP-(fatty) acid ligase